MCNVMYTALSYNFVRSSLNISEYHGCLLSFTDALRTHHFSSHILPQILEDEAEETTEEVETSKERRRLEENGESGSNKPPRSEESDHGTMNSEGFVSGAVTPTSLEEGQTEILRLRSETTTPDSGYNMSQN